MPKEEWGTKRVCPTTGKRFYDLNADPVVSPYTGEIVNIETGKSRTMTADEEDSHNKKLEERSNDDDSVLEDDNSNNDNVDLGDDVLEDDDDDDTVSLDELADVSEDKDED